MYRKTEHVEHSRVNYQEIFRLLEAVRRSFSIDVIPVHSPEEAAEYLLSLK